MQSPKTASAAYVQTFAALFATYATHRILAHEPLAAGQALTLPIFAVGLASDAWMASIFATLAALLTAATRKSWVWIAVSGLMALSAALHQAYVEFFHFQMIPYHLRYMIDPDFIWANGRSTFNGRSASISLVYAIAAFGIAKMHTVPKYIPVIVGALALFLHTRNIHYRVQWFVPESLQMNGGERLFMAVLKDRAPPPLAPEERAEFAKTIGSLTRPALDDAGLPPVALALRDGFQRRLQGGKKPLALIVLLESLRPSETGTFTPSKPTLTPHLDALYAHGIGFAKALSTGSVTRGAQEAAFCGYLGSRDTSLMRGGSIARIPCLPESIAGKGDVFWFHGGEGRFDGQLAFWKARGVAHELALEDFPEGTERTGWGVSDRMFFTRAATEVEAVRSKSRASFLLGMLLSVTNHIPWDLPKDALKKGGVNLTGEEHPSFYTTAYTDAALGTFLESLKQHGTWNDTLLIVASDHGNQVPPRADLYHGWPGGEIWRQTHINLVLAGGLAEEALQSTGNEHLLFEHIVSQSDIAALLAHVSGTNLQVMGEHPMRAPRTLPVLADLEEGVFVPGTGRLLTRDDLSQATPPRMNAEDRRALLYYRAFLQFINQPDLRADVTP